MKIEDVIHCLLIIKSCSIEFINCNNQIENRIIIQVEMEEKAIVKVTDASESKFTFVWILKDLLDSVDSIIESPIFESKDKFQWQLLCYPEGDFKEPSDWISLFLKLTNPINSNVKVSFKISIINFKSQNTCSSDGKWTFCNETPTSGWKDFIRRESLEKFKNILMVDNQLKIECSVYTSHNSRINKHTSTDLVSKPIIRTDFTQRWEIKNFQDVLNIGEPVKSSTITASDLKWHLVLYPHGKTRNSRGFVSLLLVSDNDVETMVEFKAAIINANGLIINQGKSKIVSLIGESWATSYPKFIKTSRFMNVGEELLTNNSLILIVTINILNNEINSLQTKPMVPYPLTTIKKKPSHHKETVEVSYDHRIVQINTVKWDLPSSIVERLMKNRLR